MTRNMPEARVVETGFLVYTSPKKLTKIRDIQKLVTSDDSFLQGDRGLEVLREQGRRDESCVPAYRRLGCSWG